MKKLLSILAIVPIASYVSTNVISCRNNNATQEKQDISTQKFTAVNAKKNNEAYNEIYAQVATWASPEVSISDIANDSHLQIVLYQSDDTTKIENNNTYIFHEVDYKVKIVVDDQDIYFNAMDEKTYTVEIGPNLPEPSEINLNDATVNVTTYDEVKDDFVSKLSEASGVSKVEINGEIDNVSMSVLIYDGDGTTRVTSSDKFTIVGANGKVVADTANDSHFNMATIEYKLNVVNS